MNRWFLFLYCSIAPLVNHSSAKSGKVIQVENFLASVNVSEHKAFYVRNNLEGDIEFQDSQNASLEIYVSGEDKDLERLRIQYDVLHKEDIVNIQVFVLRETTENWSMVGGLVAGVGIFLIAVVIVFIVCVFKRRKIKRQCTLTGKERGEEFEMRNRGTVVAEKLAVFEATKKEERMFDQQDGKAYRQLINRSPWMERKIAAFEGPQPVDEDGGKAGKIEVSDTVESVRQLQKEAIPSASNKVSSLSKCPTSCQFACDGQSGGCICPRGYEMNGGSCQDIDECTKEKDNCHMRSTCNNTIGGFLCTCNEGYWGDGITCKACSPRCDKTTYQAYGCGLTFDRKCVDISKPLSLSKRFDAKDTHKAQSGSKIIVLSPSNEFVLLEDRLWLNRTSETFFLQENSSKQARLHRNSNFHVDVIIDKANLVPTYSDYDAGNSNGENLEFSGVPGFSEVFYNYCREHNCTQIPKQCARGDTSQFQLTMNKPSNFKLQFNCYLQRTVPKTLYTLQYRVQHKSGRFVSQWISKTLETTPGKDVNSVMHQGTNHLDFLEVSHAVNFDLPNSLYLRARRISEDEPYNYTVADLEGVNATLGRAGAASIIDIQTKTPFSITTRTWSSSGNCQSLSDWSKIIRSPFSEWKPAELEHLGVQPLGEFAYRLKNPQRSPTMTVTISEEESILRHVLTNATIRNDETFKSSLTRTNTSWNARISGFLTTCPGFFTLEVIDEVDNSRVMQQDVVILCPAIQFKMDIQVPRNGLQDKERLFTLRFSNAKQKLDLTLALVDKAARKVREPVEKHSDPEPNPWMILMPLFAVTGCVLVSLVGLVIYAQVTQKHEHNSTDRNHSGWKFIKNKKVSVGKAEAGGETTPPKDENRLKRRHLILVAFFVVFRILYSLVFTFSMALAILTLLHANNMKIIQEFQNFVQDRIEESNTIALRMDQHREREIKRLLDSSEDIQRSCDYFIGLQLQWLRFNSTCLIQENHLKMFNKLSKKIVSKVEENVYKLKRGIDERINHFRGSTKRQLQEVKESLRNYARRVFNNGWFALPKGAYEIKLSTSRKRREISVNGDVTRPFYHPKDEKFSVNEKNDTARPNKKSNNGYSTRRKRSLADSSLTGFLDYVGVVDQEKLIQAENNIISKLEYAKQGLGDFTEVLKTGKSPEHPLSTILMCPLRYMLKSAKKQVQKGIRKLTKEGEEWAKGKAECFGRNISDFFASNDSVVDSDKGKTDVEFFSERIVYEDIYGLDTISNVSKSSESSIIKSAKGGTFYNIEKGDIMEEMVDDQKEELIERQAKIKNTTNIYDVEVFITTRKAVLGVLFMLDILLFIYRGSRTYHTAFKLIEGFDEIVDHDEDEFDDKSPNVKERAEKLLRRTLDFLAETFSRFIPLCKSLQKRLMRTNLLPLSMIIAASLTTLYLTVALLYSVMNVTVIEELGGYDVIASRLDTDLRFTNLAIEDQVDFINSNALDQYKESISASITEYNGMILKLNKEQLDRMERLNRQLCSLENDTKKCRGEQASVLNFNFQSCIIPTLEGTPYEDYDSDAYRQRLKRESKRFVDAIRYMILETIYFILSTALSILIISALAYVVFLFFKSRGMVRVKKVHVYKALPAEILEQFHLKAMESEDEQDGRNMPEKHGDHRKVKIPKVFLTASSESMNSSRDSIQTC
ncbi:Nidogen-2 [Stylophora pistillata]|uniref:Nidogen-2 n=1 Tax=Stylophora pistillata TaxID=50429 RepID=A0A2B4SSC8_STYPI|nr:Nidogen-2 [Stylophora pistillata]